MGGTFTSFHFGLDDGLSQGTWNTAIHAAFGPQGMDMEELSPCNAQSRSPAPPPLVAAVPCLLCFSSSETGG